MFTDTINFNDNLQSPKGKIRSRTLLKMQLNPKCRTYEYHTVWEHTHTHPFNGPFSGTTRVSRYQKGKTNLDFTGARDSEWQWHQLGHVQTICTSFQTDNHTNTSSLNFYRPDALPDTQPTVSKHWRHKHWRHWINSKQYVIVKYKYEVYCMKWQKQGSTEEQRVPLIESSQAVDVVVCSWEINVEKFDVLANTRRPSQQPSLQTDTATGVYARFNCYQSTVS